MHRPTGLAVDRMGNLYVAARQDNAVVKVSPSGRLLDLWGKGGIGPTEFAFRSQSAMNGVAIGKAGNIWVADTGNNRIKKLSPSGQVLAIWK